MGQKAVRIPGVSIWGLQQEEMLPLAVELEPEACHCSPGEGAHPSGLDNLKLPTPEAGGNASTEAILTEENPYRMEQNWSQPVDLESREIDTRPPWDHMEEEEAWLEQEQRDREADPR